MIDTHVHTARCRHAEGTLDEYAEAARARGMEVLAFTDHLPFPGGPEAGYCMAPDELPAYLDDVRRVRDAAAPGLEVLLGVEADWLPGARSRLEALADARLDVVIGSVHILDGWAFDDPELVDRYDGADIRDLWERYFAELASAAESGLFDVMAHPDLVKKFGFVPETDVTGLYRDVAAAIARAGVAVEINTAGLRKPCAEVYPTLALLREFRAAGVPATVGSDAHRPSEVGAGWDEAVRLLREAGYDRVVYFRRRQPIERRL